MPRRRHGRLREQADATQICSPARWRAGSPRRRIAASRSSRPRRSRTRSPARCSTRPRSPSCARSAADDLHELVELYFNDAATQALALIAALEQGDCAAAAAAAHRLKGASATVGAALVAAIAAELENRVQAADVAGAAGLVGSLERALMNTAVALRASLSTERPRTRTV